MIAAWYQGRLVSDDPIVGKHFIVLPGDRYERHWTSSAAHILVDFYLAHWQWVVTTILAVIAVAIAILQLK